jgi:hypothetical protein
MLVVMVGLEKNEASCLVDMHSLIKHITKDKNSMHVRCNLCKFGDFLFVIFVFKFARPYELIHTTTSIFILF